MSEKDLNYSAWTIIANAREWNMEDDQAAEWRDAAERWRDKFHSALPGTARRGVDVPPLIFAGLLVLTVILVALAESSG